MAQPEQIGFSGSGLPPVLPRAGLTALLLTTLVGVAMWLAIVGIVPPLLRTTVSQAAGETYYVSPSGNDGNDGLTTGAAWATISRVNAATLGPAVTVAFEGGQVFTGSLIVDAADQGDAGNPLTLTSYGSGRATIRAVSGRGLLAYNAGAIRVTDLDFEGPGPAETTSLDGVLFYNDLPGNVKLENISIHNVEVRQFGKNGIFIVGGNETSGYRNVTITHAFVHDNGYNGIFVWGPERYANENVTIDHSQAHTKTGTSGLVFSTGSGIILASVRNGLIQYCTAFNNGAHSTSQDGPMGIWAYDATSVTIQFNESAGNHSNGQTDGGGFDFDINVTNSFMQYNYTHDNDGAGILIMGRIDGGSSYSNTVRYNISENDARKPQRERNSSVLLYGGITGLDFYNNTIYLSHTLDSHVRGVLIGNWAAPTRTLTAVHLWNNVFLMAGGFPVVEIAASAIVSAVDPGSRVMTTMRARGHSASCGEIPSMTPSVIGGSQPGSRHSAVF